ncbi:hypothetical protein DFS33DRAFT_641222 [Desarmillaria ectypa]|nr:hypothetical protein DFS33DRAFT_641222 [Desarmillaria ectypa]
MKVMDSSHLSSSRLSSATECPGRFNRIVAWFKFRFLRRRNVQIHAVPSKNSRGSVETRAKPTKARPIIKRRWHRNVRPVPVFPLEITELIIYEVWNLLLSTKVRRAFRRTSMHVSHAWMATFIRISLADLRITNYAYLNYIWWLIQGGKSIACKHLDLQSYLGNCCRSMMLYINIDYNRYRHQCLFPSYLPYPGARNDPNQMLYILQVASFSKFCHDLSALRHVHLQYNNRLPFDPYDHSYRFRYFPTTVTDLEITHTFDDDFRDFPDRLYDVLGDRYIRPHERQTFFCELPWKLPHIRKLTVRGGHAALVLTIASRAVQLEEIATDVDSEQVIKGLQRLGLSNLRVTRCPPPIQGVEGNVVTLECRRIAQSN